MSDHDAVVAHVAATRFPFAGQTTWPEDYVTIVNVPEPKRAIPFADGYHYPDIAIVDSTGRLREAGEVLMTVDPAATASLKAVSEATDTDTPTHVRHFFVYVPAGMEAAAQKLLDDAAISYAGVRSFVCTAEGSIKILPFVTAGSQFDNQAT
ncbi:hypothetical protein SAMN07250955_11523 [Arboricoccus pini]|uniref:Uncharacterized protein n=1 Tax=Arboricoccus pini TaxID=1963835 RepID=A0A212RUQ3_9PROT|nr:hypothetical protein [Arboricoccus pini]SNB76462.1 hypothetical protein SAMN07250955_11523 [Arboricoccus pini]